MCGAYGPPLNVFTSSLVLNHQVFDELNRGKAQTGYLTLGSLLLMPVGAWEFQVAPGVFGPFPSGPVRLDPLCLLEEGTFGCISDAAKKPGYGTTNRSSTVLGNAAYGIAPPFVAGLNP